jgi:DNA-binding NarL/FixJ family response regulator
MTKPKSSRAEDTLATLAVAVVAPVWFQEPLAVLLQAAPGTGLWAYGSSVEELLALPMKEWPDLVLLYASDLHSANQVRQVRVAWPTTYCVALIRQPQQQRAVIEAGADAVLLQGVAPSRLLETIEAFRSKDLRPAIPSTGKPRREEDQPGSSR